MIEMRVISAASATAAATVAITAGLPAAIRIEPIR